MTLIDTAEMYGDGATAEAMSHRREEVFLVTVALAWVLHQGVVAIPKAASPEHVRQNREALDLSLTKRDLKELDRAFLRIRSEQLDAIAAGSGRAEC